MPAYKYSTCIKLGALLLFAAAASAQTTEPWAGVYQYDGAGNIKAIGTNQYVYDGTGRLRQGSAATAAQHDVQTYTYDAFGNLLNISTVRGTTTTDSIAIGINHGTNRANNLEACGNAATCYLGAFDEAGNQVTFGSTNYTFDVDGMLSELSAPGADRFYIYDADNQRTAIVAYGSATSQTWHYELRDPFTQVTREVDAAKNGSTVTYAWKKDYVRPVGRLLGATSASSDGETTVNFHLDHLSTPRLVTGANGRRLAVHTYWPFGREAAGSDVDDETLKFTTHERDLSGDGNDLDYMHARYFGSTTGRFLSPDKSDYAVWRHPQSWGGYSYVLDNPVNWVDPDGNCGEKDDFVGPTLPCDWGISEVIEVRADPWIFDISDHLPRDYPGLDEWTDPGVTTRGSLVRTHSHSHKYEQCIAKFLQDNYGRFMGGTVVPDFSLISIATNTWGYVKSSAFTIGVKATAITAPAAMGTMMARTAANLQAYPGMSVAAADAAESAAWWGTTSATASSIIAPLAVGTTAFATTADAYARWSCRNVD